MNSYQKLKLKIKELEEEKSNLHKDLYKILDGDFETSNMYKIYRNIRKQMDDAIWLGSTQSSPDQQH